MLKRRCPFLGLSSDPQTVVGFPSLRNRCHRMNSADPIRPEYQRSHCLTFNHRNCPILLGQADDELSVEAITVVAGKRRTAIVAGSVVSLLAIAVLAIFLFGGWQWAGAIDRGLNSEGKPAQQVPPDLQNAFPASLTPTASQMVIPTATELPPSETPLPTHTPQPTAIPATRRPTAIAASPTTQSTSCGSPAGWAVYTVKAGDTLSSIAAAYGITVSQLQAANCLTSTAIYVGQKLYVPNALTATPEPSLTASSLETATFEATLTNSPTPETPQATATDFDTPTHTPFVSQTPMPTDTHTPEPTEMPTSAPTLTPPSPPTASSTPISLPPTPTDFP